MKSFAPPGSLSARSWVVLGLFALAVAFLGGSSRPDAVQLVALRPISALFFVAGIYLVTPSNLARGRSLVIMLGVLAVWMLVQVVPLPPDLWHQLPGRQPIVALDAFLGLENLWRPISLNSWRGWNALASLVVPGAALLFALALRVKARDLLLLVACIGVFDAIMALMQIVTGADGPFYLYQHSNRGSPIGLFANENHSAVFSACALLVLGRLMLDRGETGLQTKFRIAYPVGFVLILVVALMGGSRAGLAAIIGALIITSLMLALDSASRRRSDIKLKLLGGIRISEKAILIAAGIAVALLPILFLVFDSLPAFADVLSQDPLQDLRWRLFEISADMAAEFWLLGVGFGAFEQVYHMFEPADMLRSSYVNQAHNDWLQIVIEGGLVGALLTISLLVWIAHAIWTLGTRGRPSASAQVFWLAVFAIVAFASLIDYPLRAPIFQMVGVWLLLALAFDSASSAERRYSRA